MSKAVPSLAERCATCGAPWDDHGALDKQRCAPQPGVASEVLTRQKFEQHLIYYGNNAARPATHPVAMESETTLLAHEPALRAALAEAKEEIARIKRER